MNAKPLKSSLAAWAILLCTACCAPAQALDMRQAVALALRGDPALQAAGHGRDAALEAVPQARAELLPEASLGASKGYSRNSYLFDGKDSARNIRQWQSQLQVSIPLWRPVNWRTLRLAEVQADRGHAQYRQAEQDVLLRLAQACLELDLASQGIAVARAWEEGLEAELRRAEQGVRAGTHRITDVHEARSRREQARSQHVAAVNEESSKRIELERIIGPFDGGLALSTAVAADGDTFAVAEVPLPAPADAAAWGEYAAAVGPDVLLQQLALRMAELDIERTKAAFQPTLDANLSYGRNFSSGASTLLDYENRARTVSGGLQLNVPLYSGGSTGSKVRQAVAEAARAREELEAAARRASAMARQAYGGIVAGRAQIAALGVSVFAAERALEANRTGLRHGTGTPIDVLNALQQLYSARRDALKARSECLMAVVRLKASTGTLAAADLVALALPMRASLMSN